MKQKKESIMKMLEMASARELEITYYFVLHLLDIHGEGANESGRMISAPTKGRRG